ncbi:hypothetical protein [Nakamurella aerolata]|uniref:Uncharacterized protein n=1 Tax=Nakamurella aerolata TaxID=1656892 RepID=A0A849AA81_9ACTN|nr:hypothetical protein [Nakamurella aerolata]NNG36506.1 hypothetical protein [Nakamurella aerolata]
MSTTSSEQSRPAGADADEPTATHRVWPPVPEVGPGPGGELTATGPAVRGAGAPPPAQPLAAAGQVAMPVYWPRSSRRSGWLIAAAVLLVAAALTVALVLLLSTP